LLTFPAFQVRKLCTLQNSKWLCTNALRVCRLPRYGTLALAVWASRLIAELNTDHLETAHKHTARNPRLFSVSWLVDE